MTMIRVSCDWCGNLELTPRQVVLVDDRYRFDCPYCGSRFQRRVRYPMGEVLRLAGCRSVEALVAPITESEIVTFAARLAGPDPIGELL